VAQLPETRPDFPESFRNNPLRQVRIVFVRFVQGLFFQAPHGSYHWDPDDESTEIVITNENKIDPETCMRRPAVSFTRGPVQFYSLGIDDMMSYEADTGKKTKSVLVPGTVTVNCVSRVELEAEDIAWTIAEHMWLLRDTLMLLGFFEIGRQPSIGSPSPAGSIISGDSGDEFTVTPVSIPYQLSRTSSTTPLGRQIIRSLLPTVTTNPLSSFNSLGPPALGPQEVTVVPPPSFAPSASDSYGRSPDPTGVRQVFLPKQPHPLNPAVQVSVRTLYPFRAGSR